MSGLSGIRPLSATVPRTATNALGQLPYAVLIDFDGTLGGNVEHQAQAYTLMQALKRQGIKSTNYDPRIAFSPETKLIRPGIASFMHTLEKFYGKENVHFFIYTASERNWALHEIGIVEEMHGIKFARPIFTRDDCVMDTYGTYRKSINTDLPAHLPHHCHETVRSQRQKRNTS